MKILMVEDDAVTMALLQMALHVEGHEVVSASDSQSAVRMIPLQRPELMLLDGVLSIPSIAAMASDAGSVVLAGDLDAATVVDHLMRGEFVWLEHAAEPEMVLEVIELLGSFRDLRVRSGDASTISLEC